MNTKILIRTACLIFVFAFTFGAYFPGLGGVFLFDDQPNITDNIHIQIDTLSLGSLHHAAISYGGSLLIRPISTLSLALNHYFAGLDPFYYKLINLVVHLLCGFAVFVLSWRLLKAYSSTIEQPLRPSFMYWLSVVVATAWLLHPINLTSVLYVVQRMNSLSALFVFSGLGLYCWGRSRLLAGRGGHLAVISAFFISTPLAFLCKENGALLPVYLLVIEVLFFNFSTKSREQGWLIGGLFTVTILIPVVMLAAFLAFNPDWLETLYDRRHFSLEERLLTQPRVLLFYLKLILMPSLSGFGLYHDDIAISGHLTNPLTTLWAILAVALALSLAVWLRKRHRLLSFGIFFYLGSHLMESTFLPLEMAHEHRNYVGSFGILFAIFTSLSILLSGKMVRFLPVLAGCAVLLLAALTTMRAVSWGNIVDQASLAVRNHPNSARSHSQLGRVYWALMRTETSQSERYGGMAFDQFITAAELDTYHRAGNLAIALRLASQDGAQTGLSQYVDKVADKLVSALNQYAVSAFSAMSMVGLGDCVASGKCLLSTEVLADVFDASLSNKTLGSEQRSRILASWANEAFQRGDLSAALNFAEQALANEPDHLQHYLNLSKLSLAAGNIEKAKQLLATARRRDSAGIYAGEIAYQESLISAIPSLGERD